ncbi:MAG: dihydroorotase [Planctomycetota bacterium]
MKKLLIRHGRVVDPAQKIDRVLDLLIDRVSGRVEKIADRIAAPTRTVEVLDAKGLIVTPGLIDIHVHFREPGGSAKETIETGAAAAVHGGFTSVVTMPNTSPPLDNPPQLIYQIRQGEKAGRARVYPSACVSVGREGKTLAPLGTLVKAGAVCFTDDGAPVASAGLMRLALEYGRFLNVAVSEHAEDTSLSNGAVINDGPTAAVMGINGYPSVAEEIIVSRDILLARDTGGRVHIQHVSTAGAIHMIRRAKHDGVPVTCEVTPHHLLLDDTACAGFDPIFKMNPPLRSKADVAACLLGLRDGTIDCIASDHAPHTAEEKRTEFALAPNGVIGLESTVGVMLELLYHREKMKLPRIVELLTAGAAAIYNLPAGTLAPGSFGDVTLLDLNRPWTIDRETFHSKARNCPFHGWKVRGAPVKTIVGGRIFDAIGAT